jgi:hypothetical protein
VLFHICRLQLVILLARVVVIVPDTRNSIFIDAGGIRVSILLRTVEDLRHEAPGIVKDGGGLPLVSPIEYPNR